MDHIMTKVDISLDEWNKACEMAELSCIGGVSRIYEDKEERMKHQYINAVVGQLGVLGASKYFFGSSKEYLMSRNVQNKFPYHGDEGHDFIGLNIDVKTSLWKYPDRVYHLCVRPQERHKNIVYVHALVPVWKEMATSVYLTGWLDEKSLPEKVVDTGPLKGAYVVPTFDLNPMMPLIWDL